MEWEQKMIDEGEYGVVRKSTLKLQEKPETRIDKILHGKSIEFNVKNE